jgi:DNA invertase Pin-like site-specific DNA recombinase
VRAFATRGWQIVAEYRDVASGKNDNRPGYLAALDHCRGWTPSSSLRGSAASPAGRTRTPPCWRNGVRPRTADMPYADDLMLRVCAAMAQRERELISERTKAALSAAKARGRQLGGDSGFRPAAQPDAKAAAAARVTAADRAAWHAMPAIEEARAAGATSLHAIADALNRVGVPTPRVGAWTATAVRRALLRMGGAQVAAG